MSLMVVFVLGQLVFLSSGASIGSHDRYPRSPQGWRGSFSPFGSAPTFAQPRNEQTRLAPASADNAVMQFEVRVGRKSPFLSSSDPSSSHIVVGSRMEPIQDPASTSNTTGTASNPANSDGWVPSGLQSVTSTGPQKDSPKEDRSAEAEERSYAEASQLPPGSFYIPAVGEKEGEYYSKTEQALYIPPREPQEPFPIQTQVVLVHHQQPVNSYPYAKEDEQGADDSFVSASGIQDNYYALESPHHKPLENVRAKGQEKKNNSFVAVPHNAMMMPPPTRPKNDADVDLLMTVYPNLPKLLPQSPRNYGVIGVQQPKPSVHSGQPPSGGSMSVIHDVKVVTPPHGYLPATLKPPLADVTSHPSVGQPAEPTSQQRGSDPAQLQVIKLNNENGNTHSTANQNSEQDPANLTVEYFSFTPQDISPLYGSNPQQQPAAQEGQKPETYRPDTIVPSTSGADTNPSIKDEPGDSYVESSNNAPLIYASSTEKWVTRTSHPSITTPQANSRADGKYESSTTYESTTNSLKPSSQSLKSNSPRPTEGPELITVADNHHHGDSFTVQVQTAFRIPDGSASPSSDALHKGTVSEDPREKQTVHEHVQVEHPREQPHDAGQPQMFGDFRPLIPTLPDYPPQTTPRAFYEELETSESSRIERPHVHTQQTNQPGIATSIDFFEDSLTSGSETIHEHVPFQVKAPPKNFLQETTNLSEVAPTVAPSTAPIIKSNEKKEDGQPSLAGSNTRVVSLEDPKGKIKKPIYSSVKAGKVSPKGVMYTVIQGHSKVKFFGYNALHGKMKYKTTSDTVYSENPSLKSSSVYFPVKLPKADAIEKRQSVAQRETRTGRVRPVFFAKRPNSSSRPIAFSTSTSSSIVSDPFEYVSQLQKIRDARGRILHRNGA